MNKFNVIAFLLVTMLLSACGWVNTPSQPNTPSKPNTETPSNNDDNNDNDDNDDDAQGANDNDGGVKPSVIVSKGVKVGNHYLVDMGEAGEWAPYNVGATKPEEQGDRFAWGETKPKARYDWETYTWLDKEHSYLGQEENSTVRFTRYNYLQKPYDGNYYLLADDDAATVNWGEDYKTPSHLEWKLLFETCSPRYIRYLESAGFGIRPVEGVLFTAKNGNTLFVPCSPSKSYDYTAPWDFGEYWTSALANGVQIEFEAGGEKQQIPYRDNMAFYMYLTEDGADCTKGEWRCTGMSVRAMRRLPEPEPEPEPEPQPPLIVN